MKSFKLSNLTINFIIEISLCLAHPRIEIANPLLHSASLRDFHEKLRNCPSHECGNEIWRSVPTLTDVNRRESIPVHAWVRVDACVLARGRGNERRREKRTVTSKEMN